jgi:chorismate-pyruvate lyase
MKTKLKDAVPTLQWLPAERLGQMKVDANVRPWLIGQGMLSARVRAACGERFALKLIDQWSGLLTGSQKSGLRSEDNAALFRDVEMTRDDQVWVFAQTVMPDSTLSLHPWLAELGDAPLDATLGGLSGVERSPYEYAWLPAGVPLAARALRAADIKPEGLWARRARIALRGAPLLMQEVFLPATGLS